jgi:hypothetical protein
MFKLSRSLPVALLAGVLLTTSACASGYYPQRYPIGDRDDRAYYDRGFNQGRQAGADDARRGRAYDLQRHGEYRDSRRGNDRGDVRAFRQGFETGYDSGYRAYARGGYGNSRGTYPNYPRQQGGIYPNSPRQQDPIYGGRASLAEQSGYRDGFDAGQHAARDGDRFDPVREKRYRDGDHDYDRRYGSRDDYKRDYREAFRQGYNDGYRGYRR